MQSKKAIIDLGTNSFHLLIVEEDKVLYKNEITVKLGEGGISKGLITEAAMKRGLDTLAQYKEIIQHHAIESIFAFGTSALRNASNASDFIERVLNSLGFTITVIDGEKEAEFIYKGVQTSGLLIEDPSLIMDVGGGSVEFIIGTETNILWSYSYELGAQRLLDKFVHSDPINGQDQSALSNYLTNELFDLEEKMKEYRISHLIGSSGTFSTLAQMLGKKTGTPIQLTLKDIKPLFDQILNSTHEHRLSMKGLPQGRADMIVPASLLVKHILNVGNFQGFNVSPFALKEGVLSSLAG